MISLVRTYLDDSSGQCYALYKTGLPFPVKRWLILYGYSTPEWQEKEKRDRAAMCEEITQIGVEYFNHD